MILWHYTCSHGRERLGESGLLLPASQLAHRDAQVPPQGHFVWLTDLDAPFRDALGLTSHTLNCDRTEYRYRVTDDTFCTRWLKVRTWFPELLHLEAEQGALPAHWWIATSDVPVIYAPVKAVA